MAQSISAAYLRIYTEVGAELWVFENHDIHSHPIALTCDEILVSRPQVAIKEEDYERAASLRDTIRDEEDRDPVLRVKARMQEAIEQQNFEVRSPIQASTTVGSN